MPSHSKQLILFLAMILIFQSVSAQQFFKHKQNFIPDEKVLYIKGTPDGGYMVSGANRNWQVLLYDFVVRYDPAGTEEWAKQIIAPELIGFESCKISVRPDGGFWRTLVHEDAFVGDQSWVLFSGDNLGTVNWSTYRQSSFIGLSPCDQRETYNDMFLAIDPDKGNAFTVAKKRRTEFSCSTSVTLYYAAYDSVGNVQLGLEVSAPASTAGMTPSIDSSGILNGYACYYDQNVFVVDTTGNYSWGHGYGLKTKDMTYANNSFYQLAVDSGAVIHRFDDLGNTIAATRIPGLPDAFDIGVLNDTLIAVLGKLTSDEPVNIILDKDLNFISANFAGSYEDGGIGDIDPYNNSILRYYSSSQGDHFIERLSMDSTCTFSDTSLSSTPFIINATTMSPPGIQVYTGTPGGCGTCSISNHQTGHTVESFCGFTDVNTIIAPRLSMCKGDSVLLESAINNFVTYEWYKNGVLLPGSNSPSHWATEKGGYSCIAIDSSGIAYLSDEVIVKVICRKRGAHQWRSAEFNDSNDISFEILPNPAIDQVTIEAIGLTDVQIFIRITDLHGRQLFSEVFPSEGDRSLNIDLRGIESGLYLVTCYSDLGQISRKLVVE
jgi:hypothetical protein